MVSKASVTVFSVIALCLVFADALPRLSKQRRCRCISQAEELQSSMRISNVKIFFSHELCPNIEIIVNLQNRRRVCLNPASEIGKKMIDLMRKKMKY
ncbi:interleukin-8-like [Heterodontus francisci]|uniref:interleukin-8-like n=1 Tax=Heterodontus francisci TaxID=7792 RepID=UPI00355C5C5E